MNYIIQPSFFSGVLLLLTDISASEVSKYSAKLTSLCSCVIKIIEPRASATVDGLKNVVMNINRLEKERSIPPLDEEHIPEEIVSTMPNPGYL